MYKKLNDLGFVIGLFFFITSLILLIADGKEKINLYTGLVFLVFGLLMMFVKKNNRQDP